ncbi:MAG: sensor histidine kinase, partial [Nitrospinales bacterium]
MTKTMKDKPKKTVSPGWMYLLISVVGIIVTGMIAYSFHKGVRLSARYAPLVDAAMEIKLEAAMAHLWFEEILSGDSHEQMEFVWEKLEQADWYARAMLEGGENPEGTFIPLDDEEMRRQIHDVREKLAEIMEITRQRLEQSEFSGAGSDIDERYDALFREFIHQADEVETRLQQVMAQDLRIFRVTKVTLIMICLLLSLLVGIAFRHFYRLQANSFKEVTEANVHLEIEVSHRKEAEQNLRQAHDHLESRVKERTAELSQANENLQTEIGERRRAETLAKAALEEKETLLQEIHHRTKNNMQIISSLLKMKSREIQDERLEKIFNDFSIRIQSMALIHEKVYLSADLAQIDSHEYITTIARALFRSFGYGMGKIDLNVKTHGVLFNMDVGIPCGLIINELVTNSLKYAFPNGAKGTIEITLRPCDQNLLELTVRDNGVG